MLAPPAGLEPATFKKILYIDLDGPMVDFRHAIESLDPLLAAEYQGREGYRGSTR